MHTHNSQQFPPVFLIKTATRLFHARPLLRGTSREHFGIQNETWHDNHELGVVSRRLDGFAGPSTLSRRLPDFYEYMYTAQSGGGFVFISPGDTSAAAPLHLFHLRRLRLALQVRSHHASMLPRHQSAAKRAQALPLLHPSLSTGNFHQFPVFSSSSFPQIFILLSSHSSPPCGVAARGGTGVKTAPGTVSSLTLCQNRCASGQEVWGRC